MVEDSGCTDLGRQGEPGKPITGIHVLKFLARSSCYRSEQNFNPEGQRNMSTKAKPKSKSSKNNGASSIVWFEIPADNVERARTFYGELFGWKIDKFPGPTQKPYWIIDTGGEDASRNGEMTDAEHPEHGITNFVAVPSVERAAAMVRNSAAKSAWKRQRCGRWDISSSVTTRRTTPLPLWEPDEKAK